MKLRLDKVTAGIACPMKDDPENRAGMVDAAGSGGRETEPISNDESSLC
jgi:hypothetical protein